MQMQNMQVKSQKLQDGRIWLKKNLKRFALTVFFPKARHDIRQSAGASAFWPTMLYILLYAYAADGHTVPRDDVLSWSTSSERCWTGPWYDTTSTTTMPR